MHDAWHQLGPGTLTDSDIITLARSGDLITASFDERNVRQACYELRASSLFYETSTDREDKRLVSPPSGYVLRPHTYVTAIVEESILLPSNVVARILTKGQLFSLGILPVNTYADPGFRGRLGITMFNASHRAVVITPGQAIAKIEFTVLPKPVERPYSGQHGYETEIWPIPVQFYATDAHLRAANINLSSSAEIARSYGPVVASLERRLRFYEAKVWLQIALTIVAFLGLFALYGQLSLIGAVLAGVAANLVTTLGFNLRGMRLKL